MAAEISQMPLPKLLSEYLALETVSLSKQLRVRRTLLAQEIDRRIK
jgi:hypothetical protein